MFADMGKKGGMMTKNQIYLLALFSMILLLMGVIFVTQAQAQSGYPVPTTPQPYPVPTAVPTVSPVPTYTTPTAVTLAHAQANEELPNVVFWGGLLIVALFGLSFFWVARELTLRKIANGQAVKTAVLGYCNHCVAYYADIPKSCPNCGGYIELLHLEDDQNVG